MATTGTVSSSGPRYAPEDPTLPKPWRGLVDSKTGYLYFWNTETNVTQYERPSAVPIKPSPALLSSSIQVQTSLEGQIHGTSPDRDRNRREWGSSDVTGLVDGSRDNQMQQNARDAATGAQNTVKGVVSGGCGASSTGSSLSADAYRQHHEITVHGDKVPPPLMSFDDNCFPPEILREVRHLLLEGANVVHWPSLSGVLSIFWATFNVGPIPGKVTLSVFAYIIEHRLLQSGDDVSPSFMGNYVISLKHGDTYSLGPMGSFLVQVHHAGFTDPTPIQAQSWPIALEGRDIVAIAKTGSGKTLGYLIPGFIHLNKTHNDLRMGPTVLVLSPTRELATQIQDEAVKFGKSSKISCTCLYGGAPKGPQLRDIDRGVHIVIATPGRLNDILEMRRISLMQVSYLVLDEADRMLDMGFEPQIRKIVNEVPSRRQTLMYTATWPKEVRKIAADLLVNPIQVNIGNVDELVANKSITQHVEVLSPLDKHRRLEQILQSQEPGSKIIIFCSTKRMCDQLARNLARHVGAAAIHGDKSQSERDSVLNQFRTGKSPVLVATDVAARGLDVKDVRVVINYDFPTGVEDYVHRIGRTGRAGASGVAYTFFGDQDARYASDLIKILEGADQKVPAEIRSMATRGGGGRFRRWGGDGGGGGGTGGRGDSGYGGRGPWSGSYGGRDGGRPQSGGNGRGSDSYRYGSNSNGYENVRSRSRSPVARESSYRGSWHNRDRSRSRSAERYDQNCSPVRSFHQTMMKR